MNTLRTILSLIVLASLSAGCATNRDGRAGWIRTAATASGSPLARFAAETLYGTGQIDDYRLPDGWDISFHPIDEHGNWIPNVAGYLPFIYPVSGDAASFIPAAFLPAHTTMPPPPGGPPPPLKPAPAPEAVRPEVEHIVQEAVESTRSIFDDR